VYAFHAGAPWQNARFPLAYVPPLAILLAAGLTCAVARISLAASAYAVVGLALMLFGAVRLNDSFVERQVQDRQLVAWVDAQATPNTPLLTFGPTLTFQHYSRLPTADLFDTDVSDAPPGTYVLVDVANIEGQWAHQAPGRALDSLRARGLTELGVRNGFTLYRLQ
jgi:hypothetical protein